jgi:hypothetical protein
VSAISSFLDKPSSRWRRFRLWLWVTRLDVRDWFLRWIYAQHNARVIADFEDRMVSVIYAATGGLMSRPYYTTEAMLQCIREFESRTFDDGYREGQKDLAEEHGLELPSEAKDAQP